MSQFRRYLEIVQEDRNYLLNEMDDPLKNFKPHQREIQDISGLLGGIITLGIASSVPIAIILSILMDLAPRVDENSLEYLKKQVNYQIIDNQNVKKETRDDVLKLMQNISYRRSSGMTENQAIDAMKDIQKTLEDANKTSEQKANEILEKNKSIFEKIPEKAKEIIKNIKEKFSN